MLITITDMQTAEVECFYNIVEALIRFGQLNHAVRRTNAFVFEIHTRR